MMIGYASRTGTKRNLDALRAAGWRLLISATGVHRDEGFPFRDRQRGLDSLSAGPAIRRVGLRSADRFAWIQSRLGGGAGHRGGWPQVARVLGIVAASASGAPAALGGPRRNDRGRRPTAALTVTRALRGWHDRVEVEDGRTLGAPRKNDRSALPRRSGEHETPDPRVRSSRCRQLRWDIGHTLFGKPASARERQAANGFRLGCVQ